MFIWKLYQNCLLTGEIFECMKPTNHLGYFLCKEGCQESVLHIFRQCSFSKAIWIAPKLIEWWLNNSVLKGEQKKMRVEFVVFSAILAEQTSEVRNAVLHRHGNEGVEEFLFDARSTWSLCRSLMRRGRCWCLKSRLSGDLRTRNGRGSRWTLAGREVGMYLQM